jgi:drug/metabolite transporter (DMT)-like permease
VNPVVAIALGAIVLHESLTWTIGVGAALVLACVAIVVRRESEAVKEPKPVPVAETG